MLSMTPQERRLPHIVSTQRRRRIAAESGTSLDEVNKLMAARKQMARMMKQLGKGKMPALPGMPPPGRPLKRAQSSVHQDTEGEMAVKIRLTRIGRRRTRIYRVKVVADSRSPRDGRHRDRRPLQPADRAVADRARRDEGQGLARKGRPAHRAGVEADQGRRDRAADGERRPRALATTRPRSFGVKSARNGVRTRRIRSCASRRWLRLLEWIARRLVDEPDAVRVETEERSDAIVFHLHVAPEDVGKVISRRGGSRVRSGASCGPLAPAPTSATSSRLPTDEEPRIVVVGRVPAEIRTALTARSSKRKQRRRAPLRSGSPAPPGRRARDRRLARRAGKGRPAIKLARPPPRGRAGRAARPARPLADDAFYVADLVGLDVVEQGGALGVVRDVLPGPANDALEPVQRAPSSPSSRTASSRSTWPLAG